MKSLPGFMPNCPGWRTRPIFFGSPCGARSAIRARLELASNLRDPALFNVAIDRKLHGCDLVKLAVTDLVRDDRVRERVSVIQSKTKRPVQFELSENTRDTIAAWIKSPEMIGCRFMFAICFSTTWRSRDAISTPGPRCAYLR